MTVTANVAQSARFILLSLPRCGSTSLARALNCHAAIRCLIEPFNPRLYGGLYFRQVSEGSVDHALRCLYSDHTGFKHVLNHNGWPFVNSPEINVKVMTWPGQQRI